MRLAGVYAYWTLVVLRSGQCVEGQRCRSSISAKCALSSEAEAPPQDSRSPERETLSNLKIRGRRGL